MREEARRCSRQLEILTEPAGDKVVMAALAPLVLVYGKGQEATAPAFWKVYTEALADLPRLALDRAAAEYTRVGKFFPKPAEIRELADRHALALRQAAYRAGKAAAWEEPKAMPQSDRIPPEQFKAMMADTLAKLDAKAAPPARLRTMKPTPSAPVDERGISDAARALLARQRPTPPLNGDQAA